MYSQKYYIWQLSYQKLCLFNLFVEYDKIKVAVIDDDLFVCQSFAAYINSFKDVQVIFFVTSAKELIKQLKYKTPDVILLDLTMTGMDGYETTEYMNFHFPEIKIIVLSISFSKWDLVKSKTIAEKLLLKGAHGFVSKNISEEDILNAIINVKTIGYYFNVFLTSEMLKNVKKSHQLKPNPKDSIFTEIDLQYLQLEYQGFKRKEVSEKLDVNPKTYDRHWEYLYDKTNSRSEAEVIQFVLDNKVCSKEYLCGKIE